MPAARTCRDPRPSLPATRFDGSHKHTGFAIADPSRYAQSPATNSFRFFQRRIASHMADEITTMIVDDHEVVREGLRLSLSRAPHIRVVGEAADGASAVEMAERRKPDVIIMDVRMPGMDGLEATKLLTEKVPESKVLIFTAYSERSLLGRGLESGAKGYILKEAPHQTLVRAIEKVAQGDGYVDPALMPAFLAGKDQTDMLTTREREILQLLADGMSNADVAGRLFISQETVKSHVRHILTKLEADTRTHAVAIALREAIID
jgi:DNA-binding NarL/FixJ family response regulator